MALAFSLVDTWDDGKRIHVAATVSPFRLRLRVLAWLGDEQRHSENLSAGRKRGRVRRTRGRRVSCRDHFRQHHVLWDLQEVPMSQCHQFEFIDLIDWRASPHSREPPNAGARPPSRGAVIAATTTSGTGGGSGGGSGSGLRGDSVVLTKERDTVAIEACKIGETPALSIARRWRILDPHPAGCSARGRHFIRLHFSNADSIDVTPHHIFTLADGSPKRAERLCLSDILVGRFDRLTLKRIETILEESKKVTVNCEPARHFYAGRHTASILTHNYTSLRKFAPESRVPPTFVRTAAATGRSNRLLEAALFGFESAIK